MIIKLGRGGGGDVGCNCIHDKETLINKKNSDVKIRSLRCNSSTAQVNSRIPPHL